LYFYKFYMPPRPPLEIPPRTKSRIIAINEIIPTTTNSGATCANIDVTLLTVWFTFADAPVVNWLPTVVTTYTPIIIKIAAPTNAPIMPSRLIESCPFKNFIFIHLVGLVLIEMRIEVLYKLAHIEILFLNIVLLILLLLICICLGTAGRGVAGLGEARHGLVWKLEGVENGKNNGKNNEV